MAKTIVSKVWDNVIVDGRRYVNAGALTILGAVHSVSAAGVALVQQNSISVSQTMHSHGVENLSVTVDGFVLNAVLSAPRSSGPAPLAVAYSATATTVTGLDAHQVKRNCLFTFEVVGQTGSQYYASTGKDRYLQAGGPIASFNVLTPGSYTIRCTVRIGLNWATNHYYAVGDFVVQSGNTYQCNTAHTSGTFSTDLSATRWVFFQTGTITDVADDYLITVTDPNSVFSGTNTVCISTSGNFSGAPSGAQLITGSSAGSIVSNKRYLFCRGESFSDVSVPFDRTNIIIGAYGSGSKPILNGVSASILGAFTVGQSEVIIQDIQSRYIVNNLQPKRWTIYNCTVPTTGIDDGMDFGAAIGGFYPGSSGTQQGFYRWPSENHMFENIVYKASGTAANLGISGIFNFGSMVANTVGRTYEHSIRIWQAANSFIAHNVAIGIAEDSATSTRHAMKVMSGGNNLVWNEVINTTGVAWPGTLEGVGGLASFNLVFADNILGSSEFNSNWIAAFGPQNNDAETVEGFQDIIYENNIHIRPSPELVWAADVNCCATYSTVRFNTATGSAELFTPQTTTSLEYHGGAGTGREVMRSNWCGPYYGQGGG